MKRAKFFKEVNQFWRHNSEIKNFWATKFKSKENFEGILKLQGRRFCRKKGVISEYLPWILIAVAVLAILMIAIFVLKDKGFSLIDRIKDLFGGA